MFNNTNQAIVEKAVFILGGILLAAALVHWAHLIVVPVGLFLMTGALFLRWGLIMGTEAVWCGVAGLALVLVGLMLEVA